MEQTTQTNSNSNTLKSLVVIVFCLAIIAFIGAGFGIYGTIQANRALSYLEENGLTSEDSLSDDLSDSEEPSFDKPTTASDIAYVSIVYNNGQDYIDITSDGTDGNIDYYTSTEDGEVIENPIDTDTTDLANYIFDNDLSYLGDNDYDETNTWSIEVDTENGYSYVGGTGTAPDWFNDLLKKLDVDKNGYQSGK